MQRILRQRKSGVIPSNNTQTHAFCTHFVRAVHYTPPPKTTTTTPRKQKPQHEPGVQRLFVIESCRTRKHDICTIKPRNMALRLYEHTNWYKNYIWGKHTSSGVGVHTTWIYKQYIIYLDNLHKYKPTTNKPTSSESYIEHILAYCSALAVDDRYWVWYFCVCCAFCESAYVSLSVESYMYVCLSYHLNG